VGSDLAPSCERDSRRIRFLLSQPVARRSIVLGKVPPRGLTLGMAFVLGNLGDPAIVLGLCAEPTPDPRWTVADLSLLLILAFVAVSVGIASAVTSRSRAISATIGNSFVAVVLSVFPRASIPSALAELGDVLGLGQDPATYRLFASVLSSAVASSNVTMAPFLQRLDPRAGGRAGLPRDGPPDGRPRCVVLVPLALASLALSRAEIG